MPFFKTLFISFCFLFVKTGNAQDFSRTWNQYFSYLDISALDQSDFKIYAAAENAIFTYDKVSQEIETISSVQGLSGEKISSMAYIQELELLFIGFENGLIQIYNETSQDVLNVVDIIDKQNILPNRKKINNFLYHNDLIYISTDFGVLEYNTIGLEFGDTFFIGDNGAQLIVNEVEIFEDFIYAATQSGIRRAGLDNPNLIDYQQWTRTSLANFIEIDKVGETLYAAATNRRIYEVNFPSLSQKEVLSSQILDVSTFNNNLLVTIGTESKWYNETYQLLGSFLSSDYNNAIFSKALVSQNDAVFIGTKGKIARGQEGFGVLKANINSQTVFEELHPEGPILNRIFQLDFAGDQIWAVHGSYSALYGFTGGIPRTGISRKIRNTWQNIPYARINEQKSNPFYINNVVINPFNANKVLISTYFKSGLLEFQNDAITQVYDDSNSSLDKAFDSFYLLMAAKYDNEGTFWITNGRVDNSLNSFKNGIWTQISLSNIIASPTNNLGFSEIDFDQAGNVFIGSSNNGVISYNVTTGQLTNIIGDDNNMPNNDVRSLQVDRNNQVWIGTKEGLRIITNTTEFVNGNPEVESIIFLDEGVPSELFFSQYVNAIAVDGSNNKWIGTFDNGVFYVNFNGQETIHHFTKDNSPLPSNNILEVKINKASGEVFFATESGMVSFKGNSSVPQETLENAYVFPNPVRPGFNFDRDKIKITGLSEDVNVKIVDVEGNLVIEGESTSNERFNGFNLEFGGGTALWNGRNLANQLVASGVYVVLLNDLESFETKVLKVMIIR